MNPFLSADSKTEFVYDNNHPFKLSSEVRAGVGDRVAREASIHEASTLRRSDDLLGNHGTSCWIKFRHFFLAGG